jgi:hypothetical protein
VTPEEQKLYDLYSGWTKLLHAWCVEHLNANVNFEFFPDPDWKMQIYPGDSTEVEISQYGVPSLVRPELKVTLALPKPQEDPTPGRLRNTFRNLCVCAARILNIDTAQLKIIFGDAPQRRHRRNGSAHEP